jgi:hypothetical protein
MKITREVIYDLLPAYFANEASADTRALIEEFFATDPEFGRMAARFQTLLQDKNRQHEPDTEAARERAIFDRARVADLRLKTRYAAVIWALASAFAWFIAFVTWIPPMTRVWNPGVILGVCFLAGAIVTFVASFFVTPDSKWRALVGLDDKTLKASGLK